MKALLIIDMSKDFIDLDGALNCGQAGVDILPFCKQLVRQYVADGHLIIDARDKHDAGDYEIASGLFPPHNMRETTGQKLVDTLKEELEGHSDQWKVVDKKTYNAASPDTGLIQLLEENAVDELHIIGVCTDICVRYTLNGLHEYRMVSGKPLRVIVHSQGVASFNPLGHEESLRHFPATFGVEVV